MASLFEQLDTAHLSDPGQKRGYNEDTPLSVVPPPDSDQIAFGALFMVADGMGGMGGGEVASKTAVAEVARRYYWPDANDADLFTRLQAALESANAAVRKEAPKLGRAVIGSTAAGLVLTPTDDVIAFNIGDCRVYRVRAGFMEQLTVDQSAMMQQLQEGYITEEEAKAARDSKVTSFLGQPIPVKPYYHRSRAQVGDVFVICSDGLWDVVEPSDMSRIVTTSDAEAAAEKLINLANERGGPDNVTAVVVRVGAAKSSRSKLPLVAAAAAALAVIAAIALLLSSGEPPPPDANATRGGMALAVITEESSAEPANSEPTDDSGVVVILSTTTFTPSPSATQTDSPTRTRTSTATRTATRAPTEQASATATRTPTERASATSTSTQTDAPSVTPSRTRTAAPTATRTPQPTDTTRQTNTPRPSATAKDFGDITTDGQDHLTLTAEATGEARLEIRRTPTRPAATPSATSMPRATTTSSPTESRISQNPTEPVSTPTGEPLVAIVFAREGVILRGAPSSASAHIIGISPREEVFVLAQNSVETWWFVETKDGHRGWVAAVNMFLMDAERPIPTATITPTNTPSSATPRPFRPTATTTRPPIPMEITAEPGS